MKNKIALITGGNRGLGRSAALHLANKGVDIILTYNTNKQEAEEVVAEIQKAGAMAVALQLDVGNSKSFDSFTSEVKKVLKDKWNRHHFDYLLNNAGTGYHASIAETTEDQFDRLVNIHFKGVFFLTQKLLPVISDGGRILNVSSGLARFSFPGYAAYASMKGAIEVLTRYLAKELGLRRIAVNTIAPGAIETDFSGGAVRDNKDLNHQIASVTALGRVGLPDDIGAMVANILDEGSGWMNAQRIEVSGGMMI